MKIEQLIKEGIEKLKDIENHIQEVYWITACALEQTLSYLRAWPESELDEEKVCLIRSMFERRSNGEPLAYILGHQSFGGRDFIVSPDTLIPRDDTYTLIEAILALELDEHTDGAQLVKPIRVLDCGTGTGIIATTLKCEKPHWDVCALEFSKPALDIAILNAKRHKADIHFTHGSWSDKILIEKFSTQALSEPFDVIVSNPPYIDKEDVHLEDAGLQHEPRSALVADNHGMAAFYEIIHLSQLCLKQNGYLVFEHGYNQALSVKTLLESTDFEVVASMKDLGGNDRVCVARRKKSID